MIRVVLDPTVVVSAVRAPEGTSRRALDAVLVDGMGLIVSAQRLAEIREVTARPRFRRWFSVEAAQLLIAEICSAGLQFNDPVRRNPLGPDPDDDYRSRSPRRPPRSW